MLFRIISRIGIVGLILGLAVGAYAYTAANTVNSSKAGDGTGTVSGYTVSAIHYTLNATTPTNVSTVGFTLDSAPVTGSTLKAQIGGIWYACTNSTTSVTCDTTVGTQLTVGNATSLEALAAD